jgi:hypothetical protein
MIYLVLRGLTITPCYDLSGNHYTTNYPRSTSFPIPFSNETYYGY